MKLNPRVPELQAYATKLNMLKQQFAREGKLPAVAAVDAELRDLNQQIQMAQDAGNPTKSVAQQLTLISAVYGHLPTQARTVNIERILRQAMTSGQSTIKLNNAVLNNDRDPAPYASKEIIILRFLPGVREPDPPAIAKLERGIAPFLPLHALNIRPSKSAGLKV